MKRTLLGRWIKFLDSKEGAVAPTLALSLFGLIAAGGIAFDYARLAAMDTELQQAADQAALAAATQLDRAGGAQARAATAIQDGTSTNRLASNLTRFANDSAGSSVEIADITFCSEFDDSEPDTDAACEEAEDDSDSAFVIVTTELRTANYALTPIVAAISGTIEARAVAGVESSICNVAPLLVCAPNTNFPSNDDIGKGIVMKVAGGDQWVPGNYGLLDFGAGKPAVEAALMGFGLNGCQSSDDNQTEPGNADVTNAINTRFDVYDGGGSTKDPSACKSDGTGCPAKNVNKDMALSMEVTYSTARTVTVAPTDTSSCGDVGNNITYATDYTRDASSKGLPRDTCHYSSCSDGNFGDGDWDRAGYMAANHPGVDIDDVATAVGKDADKVTRYDVYNWELNNEANGKMAARQIGTTPAPTTKNGPQQTTIWTYTKQCQFKKPKLANTNYPDQKDRRVLPIVAADCSNLKGKGEAFEDYVLLRVFDVFLPEPSLARNSSQEAHEIYGEILGPAETFAGSSGFQYYSRNRPYLVR